MNFTIGLISLVTVIILIFIIGYIYRTIRVNIGLYSNRPLKSLVEVIRDEYIELEKVEIKYRLFKNLKLQVLLTGFMRGIAVIFFSLIIMINCYGLYNFCCYLGEHILNLIGI